LINKSPHKFNAVIFDLGGTLTYGAAWSEYVDAAREIASVIAAPADDFVRIWFEQAVGLGTGLFPRYQDFIKHICRQLRLTIPDNLLDRAASISLSMAEKHIIVPRDGAIEVLSYLKANGYKVGLISDCGPDVPALWDETPFAPLIDAAVFSCVAGMNKGDPRIFQIAIEKLAVKPENCIYVADGMRNELTNAKKLGMTAVQLLVPGEIDDSPIREDWHGPVITTLSEVLNFIK
jgi:putative hydrolase of the HAD superfamily